MSEASNGMIKAGHDNPLISNQINDLLKKGRELRQSLRAGTGKETNAINEKYETIIEKIITSLNHLVGSINVGYAEAWKASYVDGKELVSKNTACFSREKVDETREQQFRGLERGRLRLCEWLAEHLLSLSAELRESENVSTVPQAMCYDEESSRCSSKKICLMTEDRVISEDTDLFVKSFRFLRHAIDEVEYIAVQACVSDGQISMPASVVLKLCEALGTADATALIVKVMRRGCVTFPWKKYCLHNLHERYSRLAKYKGTTMSTPFRLVNHNFKSRHFFSDRLADGRYVSFLSLRDDYELDTITDYFTEEARLSAYRSDYHPSVLSRWDRDDSFVGTLVEHILFQNLDAGDSLKRRSLDSHSLRDAMYNIGVKECTQFKITLALSVFQYFRCKRVLDFSAGWGDRLIAALAYGLDQYVGYDPNTTLRQGHSQIMDMFANYRQSESYEIIYEPFEQTDPENLLSKTFGRSEEENAKLFDTVFTSPPFYDFESYSELPGQSVASFTSLESWIVRFLFHSIEIAWQCLAANGHVIIHLADVYFTRVTEPINLLMQWRLPGATYVGVLGCRGLAGKARPLWTWRKDIYSESDHSQRAEEAAEHLREHFYTIYKEAVEVYGTNDERREVMSPYYHDSGVDERFRSDDEEVQCPTTDVTGEELCQHSPVMAPIKTKKRRRESESDQNCRLGYY